MALRPASGSIVAQTTMKPCDSSSALRALVTKSFSPLRTQLSPSFTARVRMAEESDPQWDSVRAMQVQVGRSPWKRSMRRFFCSSVPVFWMAFPPRAGQGRAMKNPTSPQEIISLVWIWSMKDSSGTSAPGIRATSSLRPVFQMKRTKSQGISCSCSYLS